MKLAQFIFLFCSLGLTVSCAHKEKMASHDKQKTQVAKVEGKKQEAKKEAQDKTADAYTCLVAGDTRTVTIDKKEKRCEVHYLKNGESEQVAWAESTPNICQEAFQSIRTNIEGRGFKCEDGLNSLKKEEKKPVETAANTK